MANDKFVNFKTERLTLKYAKGLLEARKWNNKLKKSVPAVDGDYSVSGLLTPDAAAPLIETINEALEKEGVEPDTFPYSDEKDKDTGKKTGLIEVKFKAYGTNKDDEPQKVRFVDAKGVDLPKTFKITSGSEAKIYGWISVGQKGARLNIRAVQVLKYREYQQDNFDVEEDGYTAPSSDNNSEFDDETGEDTKTSKSTDF